jgi:arylsulfatase A-like enzyme
MYEGGLKVPTCIAWPAQLAAGRVCENRQLSMDLFPTLLEIAGVDVPQNIDGRSFLADLLLPQSVQKDDRDLYFTRREGGKAYGGQAIYAIRKVDWKLLQNTPYEPYELYNLKDDPQEQHNVLHSEPENTGN